MSTKLKPAEFWALTLADRPIFWAKTFYKDRREAKHFLAYLREVHRDNKMRFRIARVRIVEVTNA